MKKTTTKKTSATKAPKKDVKEKGLRVKLEDELLKEATGGMILQVMWKNSQ